MNFRNHCIGYALAAAALLSACGGNPARKPAATVPAAPAGDYFVGNSPVFARLVSDRGGSWVFTDVYASEVPLETGYLVRLNDLTPAFDTRVAECAPQVYPDGHRCSRSHPFRDKNAGVIDKIISGGIAVGTAGKVTDISQSYETSFDESRFNRAVDEALINSGLTQDRRRLINLLETYTAELDKARARLEVAASRLVDNRVEASELQLDIQPSVDGLVEYYAGDIDFHALVQVTETGAADVPDFAIEQQSILPCKAASCIAGAEAALGALERQVQQQELRLASAGGERPQTWSVSCEPDAVTGYLLATDCPAEIVIDERRPTLVPLRVTILSRDFEALYPAFTIADEFLRVTTDGKTVTFSNITNEYITVTAQTVYYNNQVNTTGLQLDLPPGISVPRPIDDFLSRPIDIESTYRQMTPDKAAGAEFRFGIAARYRVASRTEEQTLHDLRAFNVGCVIRERIRPGSCQEEHFADSSRSRGRDEDRKRQSAIGPM